MTSKKPKFTAVETGVESDAWKSESHAVEEQTPSTAEQDETQNTEKPVEPATIESPPVTPDPFDLANLRLAQNFNETAGVKKLLRTVPVRKTPNKQDFIRVHPDASYRENFAVIELKEDREIYLVAGSNLIAELAAEVVNVTVYTAINRQGVIFLWWVRLPNADGKEMEWHRSARDATEEGTRQWIRVVPNMSLGAYEIIVAEKIITQPQWPNLTFQELIRIAFRERLITSLDHPVIKRLRGLT
jgi:hypothetical protein